MTITLLLIAVLATVAGVWLLRQGIATKPWLETGVAEEARTPPIPAAKIGLGRIELALGNSQRAMHLWRAAAENAEDVRALDEIARLLGGIADSSGVQEIRKDRQRIEREASTDKLRPSAGPPTRPRTGALASHSRRTGSL